VRQPLAQRRRGSDQDRGQCGASGLAGLDGVVPVDHQQPQRLPVPVGAYLRRVRAGEQLTGRADGVDRIAVACTALAGVAAGIDLADLLARTGQVAGQAQPVMPGPFHRPPDPAVPSSRPGPGQQLRISRRRGWHLQPRHRPPPGIAQSRGMGVQVRVGPDDPIGVPGMVHSRLLRRCDAGIAAPAWRETPAAIL
jgi:hypothetical protein